MTCNSTGSSSVPATLSPLRSVSDATSRVPVTVRSMLRISSPSSVDVAESLDLMIAVVDSVRSNAKTSIVNETVPDSVLKME